MEKSSRFTSTIKLGRYDVVNTPSVATPTANVKLEPVITNVSGTGLSRIITTQIINTGNFDAHNVWVNVEVFSHGSRVKLDGQDYLRVYIGTVKPGNNTTETYERAIDHAPNVASERELHLQAILQKSDVPNLVTVEK